MKSIQGCETDSIAVENNSEAYEVVFVILQRIEQSGSPEKESEKKPRSLQAEPASCPQSIMENVFAIIGETFLDIPRYAYFRFCVFE